LLSKEQGTSLPSLCFALRHIASADKVSDTTKLNSIPKAHHKKMKKQPEQLTSAKTKINFNTLA